MTSKTPLNIAVIGASGSIGSAIVREALDRGHNVTAVARIRSRVTITHPSLTIINGDVLDSKSVTEASVGQAVVISAVGGGDGPGHTRTIKPAAESLVAGLRALGPGAPRLITVGGAGSLSTADGKQVWDTPGLPDFLLEIMHAHGDALDYLRQVEDVDWTNLSPAGHIAPGERTGTYRIALDELVVNSQGESRISTEDYAVAMLDEVETPAHSRRRFTVGY